MTRYKTSIIITLQHEGFHRWENAPEEVNFLRAVHRHMFHIKLALRVHHNDRDKEFFMEQRKLKECIEKLIDWENTGSCEMIAQVIMDSTEDALWCEVWEDGENGARLELVNSDLPPNPYDGIPLN